VFDIRVILACQKPVAIGWALILLPVRVLVLCRQLDRDIILSFGTGTVETGTYRYRVVFCLAY
jgi:hypothetical protein